MEAEKQRLVAQKFEQKARTGDVMIQEKTTFSGLMLAPEVLEGLSGAGFEVPSPIQLQAIPLGRAGLDLIVQAKSGTGKTCVFTVIALESIDTENTCMQVVILAPTREIAVQIWEVIKSIGRTMEKLRCYVFIGGLNVNDDKLKLKKCHIAVATPGRFRQLIEMDAANVNSVRLFVLDEADKLLEAGFQDDINWIYSALPMNKQMIAASATYPEYLAQQLTTYMRSPKMIRLNTCDPALLGISQYYVLLPFSSLPYKVYEEKSEFLLRLLSSVDFQQCLVFSNYQSRAQSLSKLLDSKGWPSTFICGSQEQEKRLTAMAKLRRYQCRVLISTDLTSRGIDVENVNLVVNLDLPADHETYLHRIGRAGRYGSFGAAVTLVTQGKESANLRLIEARCQTSIQLLPDPIPEGLTHSCPKVDLTVEVTVEEALPPCHSPDGPQVKLYEEAEDIFVHDEEAENIIVHNEEVESIFVHDEEAETIFVHGISDAGGIKWTEQEFILNNSTGHKDHTTGHIGHEDATMGHEDHTTGHIGHEDHTTMHEDHATGQAGHSPGHEDHTIGHEGHTTGHKEHTAGHEDHKMWHEDHTTSHEDHTTVHEDHTTGHEEHTAEHKEHTAEHEDHTTWHEDHTTRHEDHITRHADHAIGHEEHTAGHKEHTAGHEDGHGDHTTGYDEMSVKSSEKQAPTPGINSNDSLNVDVLRTSDIQDEGKTMNEDKGFAVRIELTKKQYSSAFKTGESNATVHNPKSGHDFDALKKTGIVDNLCENEINASEENRIDSFTADDDRGTNSDGVLSGSAVNGVEYGDMKINVNNSNQQSNALDELPTIQIEPRSDHVKESLNWCSLVKETLPVSDQVLYSLGDLVSMSRSHVLEKDGAGEASESVPGPKWAAEDVPEPADESVFEDVGRLIADSDYGYATQFPRSATLLGDILELDGMTFVSPDERRVILSGGDAALQKPSTEERLPSVEASVDRSAGDAYPLNFSGEERLPSRKDLWDAASAEKECTLEKEKTLDLQAIPKSCSMSSGRVHQEAQTCRRVKWSRDKLLSMERLADNVVIAPDVARLVQELCIERGCENAARGDTWVRRGNVARGGRPGSKFGGHKQNYGSNRREPLSSVSAVSSDTAPIGTSSSMRSSSYSTAEAAAPSVPPEDSIDAKYPASSKSNYRMTEAIEASAVWVPGSHSNDLASTLIPPTDARLCTASLTSEAWHSRADTIVVRSTASPAMSCYLSMASASPVNPPVGCIDTRGTATLTPSIQKTCDMSSKTYSSGGYQVSDHFDICHSITEDAGMRSPSNHLQSDQTFSTTVCDEPSTTAPSPPLSNSGKHSPESDKPLQSTSFQPDAGNGTSEPEYRPAMSVFRPEHQQTSEESCGAILSYPAHSEFSSIPNIKGAICEDHFLETYQGNNGKFSELPCDSLASPRPEPLRVADDADNETLGRDYMLKLSACRDVIESSSDFSYATESGFQDDAGGLFWKPSAKQTRKKSAEKKQHGGSRARNQARQGQPTREHKERCRTAKAENVTDEETCHIASRHEVHKSHRLSHNDFVEQQAFQGGTRHKIHSRASARGIPNSRDSTDVRDSIPHEYFPGYANLDAYTSYYWNSYMSHLYDAEHFRQLLTSLADQTRLQDIAVQQAAYIQHMIAFHRTL